MNFLIVTICFAAIVGVALLVYLYNQSKKTQEVAEEGVKHLANAAQAVNLAEESLFTVAKEVPVQTEHLETLAKAELAKNTNLAILGSNKVRQSYIEVKNFSESVIDVTRFKMNLEASKYKLELYSNGGRDFTFKVSKDSNEYVIRLDTHQINKDRLEVEAFEKLYGVTLPASIEVLGGLNIVTRIDDCGDSCDFKFRSTIQMAMRNATIPAKQLIETTGEETYYYPKVIAVSRHGLETRSRLQQVQTTPIDIMYTPTDFYGYTKRPMSKIVKAAAQALIQGENVGVYGSAGVGKSSLLARIGAEVDDAGGMILELDTETIKQIAKLGEKAFETFIADQYDGRPIVLVMDEADATFISSETRPTFALNLLDPGANSSLKSSMILGCLMCFNQRDKLHAHVLRDGRLSTKNLIEVLPLGETMIDNYISHFKKNSSLEVDEVAINVIRKTALKLGNEEIRPAHTLTIAELVKATKVIQDKRKITSCLEETEEISLPELPKITDTPSNAKPSFNILRNVMIAGVPKSKK